jgi:AcrR family transcriptional regulator
VRSAVERGVLRLDETSGNDARCFGRPFFELEVEQQDLVHEIVEEKTSKRKKRPAASPRERLLAAAADLFYKQGIRAVGVEAIAESAGTNKVTLYRHFASKDELVAEYLRGAAAEAEQVWSRYEREHPGAPLDQLKAWLRDVASHVANTAERGCALANAAVELPEKDHPARPVIEAHMKAYRDRLVGLARAAKLHDPELLADELHLMLEGARVSAQSGAADGLGGQLVRIGDAMIAAQRRRP